MITIIVGFILGFIYIGMFEGRRMTFKERIEEIADDMHFAFLCGVVGGALGLIISIALPVQYEQDIWEDELIALNDVQGIEGRMFLGSGNINGVMTYAYYRKISDTEFFMETAPYYRCTIVYSDNPPKMVVRDMNPKRPLWLRFAIDPFRPPEQKISFHVPKGSITTEFRSDLQ